MINKYLQTLIKEELDSILAERKKQLNMKRFTSLDPDRQLRKNWLRLNGNKLGEGSSRVVYAIDTSKVLKQAINAKGVAQNNAELKTVTNPHFKPLVAEIYDYDPAGEWLVSEIVRPMKGGEFEKQTGISFKNFMDGVAYREGKSYQNRMGDWVGDDYRENEFVVAAYELMQFEETQRADLFNEEHWGVTGDGRIVVLDYGYNDEVKRNHYSGNAWDESEDPSNFDTKDPDAPTLVK